MKIKTLVQSASYISTLFFPTLAFSVEQNDALDLIVTDLKRTTSVFDKDVSKDASTDCWLGALNNLEFQSITEQGFEYDQYNGGVKLSPAGNFCAHLRSGNHLDTLAFELTRCEYEKFGEPLPANCSLKGTLLSRESMEASLRNCMSSLSKEVWLVIWTSFTQYKISSYNLCSKLTEELTFYRQKVTAYHLEKTIFGIEGKIDEVLSKADHQLEEKANLIESKFEAMKMSMKDDMKDIMYKEMKTVEELYSETKNVLHKADEKLDEASKKMDTYFQHVVSELYKRSGLQAMVDIIVSKIKRRWVDLRIFSRSMMMITTIIFVTSNTRIRKVRTRMILLSIAECVVDLNLNHPTISIAQFDQPQKEMIISSLRRCILWIQLSIIILTFLGSFFGREKNLHVSTTINHNDKKSSSSVSNQISSKLDTLRKQIENDRQVRRKEQEEFNQQLMVMNLQHQQQRDGSFSSTKQQCHSPFTTPFKREVPFTTRPFTTPYKYNQIPRYTKHFPPRHSSPSLVPHSHQPNNAYRNYFELEGARQRLEFSLENNNTSSNSSNSSSNGNVDSDSKSSNRNNSVNCNNSKTKSNKNHKRDPSFVQRDDGMEDGTSSSAEYESCSEGYTNVPFQSQFRSPRRSRKYDDVDHSDDNNEFARKSKVLKETKVVTGEKNEKKRKTLNDYDDDDDSDEELEFLCPESDKKKRKKK